MRLLTGGRTLFFAHKKRTHSQKFVLQYSILFPKKQAIFSIFSCFFSLSPRYPKTSTSRILSSVSNTLWASRISFEIRHLRRLRLERSRESLSRSWWLAQSYPAHVADGGKYPAVRSSFEINSLSYLSLQIILPLDKSYGESSIVISR